MMSLYENIDIDFELKDARGQLVQLIHGGYSQVNVLETKMGVNRGGHFHKICHEAFYIVDGKVEVTLKKGELTEKVIFGDKDFFRINPFITHSMYFLTDCLMVQMYDVPIEMDNGQKDIYTE